MIDTDKIITEIKEYLFTDYDSSEEALRWVKETIEGKPWQSSTLKAIEICTDLAVSPKLHCFAIKSILNNNGIV